MYNVQRVIHVLVRAKLALDVAVAEDAHLGLQFLAVHAQNAPVELQRGEQRQGLAEAGLGAHCCRRGEEAEGRAHLGGSRGSRGAGVVRRGWKCRRASGRGIGDSEMRAVRTDLFFLNSNASFFSPG